MFIKKLLAFIVLSLGVAGCTPQADWFSEYGDVPAANPGSIDTLQYGTYGAGMYAPMEDLKNVSVLLPLSGPNATVGRSISTAVEMAFLQRKFDNISVTFFDVAGNKLQKQEIIMSALATQPDIIIGPVFAEDVQMVRTMKPDHLPVLSFSSDVAALGNGVMTMALLPTQSVEAVVREISFDKAHSFIIFAPKTKSGELMAGAAVQAANTLDVPLSGLFYYNEGDSESIKQAAKRGAMFDARAAANNRAREILADILVKERLTDAQKADITAQLEKISKSDTLGKAPYDAILFLGNTSDSKTIASFLRYYDVPARDAQFYGTALWDSPDLWNDLTMTGAKFAALPAISPEFSHLYEQVAGNVPNRLATFGFDAANLTIGMLHSNKNMAAYLLDPSGYRGLDGLFRLRPAGTNERALQVVELNGSGDVRIRRPAPSNFLTPIYSVQPHSISYVGEKNLVAPGINPSSYINIPAYLQSKYKSQTFGANMSQSVTPVHTSEEIVIMPEDDRDVFDDPEFQPITLEPIDRRLIDSVEVNE